MAAAKTTPKVPKAGKEIGASGTNISGGVIIGEDYNPKLSGTQANRVWSEMSSSDATVNAALDVVKLPIKNAEFTVDPASDDEADKEVAAYVDYCLFKRNDWDQFLDEVLTYLEFGHDAHEMVFEPEDYNGKLMIALTKLGYRKQTTISHWAGPNGEEGIQQLLPDGKSAFIPQERLICFAHKKRGDNYRGISILRTAYKHWYIKDKLYRIDAVGHERQALGVVDISYPGTPTPAEKAKMAKQARNLRASESSYLMHPKDWEVGFMDMKGGTLRDIMPSISHHDRQIMKNVLAQFLEIGAANGGGTRSTSEDQSKLLEMCINAVAKRIVRVLQNTVVKAIVDLNFTGREYPTLRVGNISDDNIPVISDAAAKFVTAGALHPRGEDENTVRKMLGWRELEDDELAEMEKEAKAAEAAKKAAAEALQQANGNATNAPDAKPPKDPNKDKVAASAVLDAAKQLSFALTDKLYGPSKAA